MSRLFMTGWEAGSTGVMNLVGAPDIVSANQRTGSHALRIDAPSEGCHAKLGGSFTELYARIAYRCSGPPGLTYAGPIISFQSSAQANKLALCLSSNSQTLSAWAANASGTATLLASGSALPLNSWTVIEVHVVLDDVNGVFEVRLNGGPGLDIDYDGDTDRYGAVADLSAVGLGQVSGTGGTTSWNDKAAGLYDDFAVNDTAGAVNNSWIGTGGIQAIRPSGAGAHTMLTPSAGANWDCVEESPPSDANYVSSPTANDIDSYACTDLVGAGNITAVCPWVRCKSSAAGASSMAPLYRIGGVDYERTIQGFDVDWVYKYQIEETSPATGVAWTVPEVNGMELGVQVE